MPTTSTSRRFLTSNIFACSDFTFDNVQHIVMFDYIFSKFRCRENIPILRSRSCVGLLGQWLVPSIEDLKLLIQRGVDWKINSKNAALQSLSLGVQRRNRETRSRELSWTQRSPARAGSSNRTRQRRLPRRLLRQPPAQDAKFRWRCAWIVQIIWSRYLGIL